MSHPTPRYVSEPNNGAGFSIRDRENPDWQLADVYDEATANRIARLLSEEEHFMSQEPPPGSGYIAAINDN